MNTPPSVSIPSDKRGHVEQQHVLDVALQNASLNGSAHGDDFVRVHAGVRFLAEEALHDFAHLGHAGHTANHDDFVNRVGLDTGVGNRLLARLQRALDQVVDQLFKVGARDRLHQVLRTVLVSGDERQVDFGRLRRRQLDLRLFRRFLQTLQRELVLGQVNAFGLLEIVARNSTSLLSKSSPPRKVSPLVDFTSNTPSPTSRIEMSNVPPPRS